MLDPTKIPADADLDVREQFLRDLMEAMDDGLSAAQAVAGGDPADIEALDRYAQVLEALRIGAAHEKLRCSGFLEPTKDDVRNVRHLVQLVRDGAPSEALVEPAQRAARVVTDGWDLERFQSALFCLEEEASRLQHLQRIEEVLDLTVALFERGCRAAGFVATPADVVGVRRLRQVAAAEGDEARAERLRLVQELNARLPATGSIVEGENAAEMLHLRR